MKNNRIHHFKEKSRLKKDFFGRLHFHGRGPHSVQNKNVLAGRSLPTPGLDCRTWELKLFIAKYAKTEEQVACNMSLFEFVEGIIKIVDKD